MFIKEGVKLKGVQPETVLAMGVCDAVYKQMGFPSGEVTITSVMDGQHMPGSLHYKGLAFDFRTRDLQDWEKDTLVKNLRLRLGLEYDVVLEPDHGHVEFDPKG